jgi:hypothetical protein
MCKATVELKFNTAVTCMETSFKKLILDRTRNSVRYPDAFLTFPCLTRNLGQIIYYFIFGVLGACRQAPYNFKKSYKGGSVWGLPIVSILGTDKPTIFP